MVILNRNINIADNRELVEDVTAQEIADKGLGFSETFWQVHQGYVKNRECEAARITDREILNMADNLLREEGIRAIGARVLSLHEFRKQ